MAPLANKVLEFPKPRDQGLDEAVQLCNAGQLSAALVCLVRLIDEGCDEAYYYAGRIYEEGGKGVEHDLSKALFYYEKAAERRGSVEAAVALGRLYYFGVGVAPNYKKALEFLKIAADDANHAVAQMILGQMYAFGHGVRQSTDIAREYFQKAADQGYVFPLSALSTLEWRSRNYWKSAKLRLKAMWLAIRISQRDPNDERLRRS